jgi:hypothetical protein
LQQEATISGIGVKENNAECRKNFLRPDYSNYWLFQLPDDFAQGGTQPDTKPNRYFFVLLTRI